jgi:hypothetical protein
MNRLLLTLAIGLCAQSASGQIVECIDAKGAKTMAQFCPPGTVKEVKRASGGTTSGPASAPAPAGKSLAEQDAAFRKRTLERQEAETKSEKEKAESKSAERNCSDARAQLKQLQDGMRVSKLDPATGERNFLEDKDRPAEIANAQKAVDGWCKK